MGLTSVKQPDVDYSTNVNKVIAANMLKQIAPFCPLMYFVHTEEKEQIVFKI